MGRKFCLRTHLLRYSCAGKRIIVRLKNKFKKNKRNTSIKSQFRLNITEGKRQKYAKRNPTQNYDRKKSNQNFLTEEETESSPGSFSMEQIQSLRCLRLPPMIPFPLRNRNILFYYNFIRGIFKGGNMPPMLQIIRGISSLG